MAWQTGTWKRFKEAVDGQGATDREAIEAAMRPVGCRSCGQTYGSSGAYLVHFEQGEGSRCLTGDARGQLVDVDGVYCLPGSDAARR